MHVNVEGFICMVMRQIVSMFVLYCSGQLVAEQKVSAWWAVWADFGIHHENNTEPRTLPKRGLGGACVRERERLLLLVKVCFI